MKTRLWWVFVLCGFMLACSCAAQLMAQSKAIPTKVLVRAVSRDAKIIGTGVGGAQITIYDVDSGELLVRGVQLGGTGSTEKIIVKPRERHAPVYDTEGAAHFLATLMLERPTVVEIVAEGPLGAPQAMQRASKTLLLVPGYDILGEGVLLEIHGFIVTILAPAAETELTAGSPITVRATLTMT